MKTHRYILEITSQDGRVSLPDDDVIKAAIQYVLYAGQKASIAKVDLPEGLDEAADTYSENILANGEDMFDAIADGFIAGAEWMAGQGVNADFGVCKLANRAWLTAIDEKKFAQDIFDNFVAGDKVVVQIRKA